MKSTFSGNNIPQYLGVDLTDRYSKQCRDIDVCGLNPSNNDGLEAFFWSWQWDAAPQELDVTAIVKELSTTQAVMIDGPQGLAAEGRALRDCERKAAAAGKTPDVRPVRRPFAGFICSSLDLFAALKKAGTKIGLPGFRGGVSEVYPGHIWSILSGSALPKKISREGRVKRKLILEALGVIGLPDLPTHDQNDACVSALIGVAAYGAVSGVTTKGIGVPLAEDEDGILREGLMVIPELSLEKRETICKVLPSTPLLRLIGGERESNES